MSKFELFIFLLLLCFIFGSCSSSDKTRYTDEQLDAMEQFTLLDPKVNPKPEAESFNDCMRRYFNPPRELLNQNRLLRAVIQFDVTPDGRTRNHSVISSDGYELSNAAISVLRQCPYKPGKIDGEPVYVTGVIQAVALEGR